ncbi:MAG: 2-polyprenyl-3-methyl-6-methoxy-1,4-benzoquinone monooxygenase, partial [Gammaproteobacteria bacterium]|nr:2-polyprenyl-3-methyl-6-methoxy-1,4-benzoquinone monooxygenase [Gammaproteobacteria bacterium]
MQRQYSPFDQLIVWGEKAINLFAGVPDASRPSPAEGYLENTLSDQERKLSANLLRVDHAGEVCAQALYIGHAFTAKNPDIKAHMLNAAQEEVDHLAWCAQRLIELGDHVSYLNAVWYAGSFAIGALSGLCGDKWNLGFVAETENQVEAHLKSHLSLLPREDEKSRHILLKMKEDEIKHARE